jgi:hypothetical protein
MAKPVRDTVLKRIRVLVVIGYPKTIILQTHGFWVMINVIDTTAVIQ